MAAHVFMMVSSIAEGEALAITKTDRSRLLGAAVIRFTGSYNGDVGGGKHVPKTDCTACKCMSSSGISKKEDSFKPFMSLLYNYMCPKNVIVNHNAYAYQSMELSSCRNAKIN